MPTLIKCKCQHCDQNIEFDSSASGQSVNCPGCGMETVLVVRQTSSPKPIVPAAPLPEIKSDVEAYLEKVRSGSCYRLLRGMIDVGTALSCLGAFVYFIIQANADGSTDSSVGLAVFVSIIAVVFALALRQSALLMVDLADTTLRHHTNHERK